MSDRASVTFAQAHKALCKSADANPDWFRLACDTLKRTDDGKVLLLQAMLEGLKEAYEYGKAGKGLPPLKHLQSIAMPGTDKNKVPDWRASAAEPEPEVAAARPRSRRPAPAPVQQPAPVPRISRRR